MFLHQKQILGVFNVKGSIGSSMNVIEKAKTNRIRCDCKKCSYRRSRGPITYCSYYDIFSPERTSCARYDGPSISSPVKKKAAHKKKASKWFTLVPNNNSRSPSGKRDLFLYRRAHSSYMNHGIAHSELSWSNQVKNMLYWIKITYLCAHTRGCIYKQIPNRSVGDRLLFT